MNTTRQALLLGFDGDLTAFEQYLEYFTKLKKLFEPIDFVCCASIADTASQHKIFSSVLPFFLETGSFSALHVLKENTNCFYKMLGRTNYSYQLYWPMQTLSGAYQAYEILFPFYEHTSTHKNSLLLGFHHGLGDFIAFTPTLMLLSQAYDEIHLCCQPALCTSGLLTHCPYLAGVYPNLEHPWGEHREDLLRQNYENFKASLRTLRCSRHFYLPDFWQGQKIEAFSRYCCTSSIQSNFDVRTSSDLVVWLDPHESSPRNSAIRTHLPFLFLHNQSDTWHRKYFDPSTIPEVTQFDGPIISTCEMEFSSILEAFVYMQYAERVVLIDSVFMWAAWALKKPIDYLHFIDVDERVQPLAEFKHLVRRSNIPSAQAS